MAFRSTILNGVDTAFSLAGDLVTEVKFIDATPGTYDFSNQTVTVTDSDTETISGIVERIRRVKLRGSARPVLEARVIFKKEDVGMIDAYDSMEFQDRKWELSLYEDNDYTVTATLISEI